MKFVTKMRLILFAATFLHWHGGFLKAKIWNRTCGKDLTKSNKIYEGIISIERYPWIGILYYTKVRYRVNTMVVLVTKQMVLGSAMEIELIPKLDFRAKTRVVLGGRCGEKSIKIRDYTYHPEFYKGSANTLALVQLETDHVTQELRPICAPFSHLYHPEFYAMTASNDCRNPRLTIFKMFFVNTQQCEDFYLKSRLNHSSVWPSHVVCARSMSSRECVWRSGTVLVTKQAGRWGLLGFGVHGPGCSAPSRFIDFGKYYKWVRRSVATVGRPSITRLDSNLVVLRRTLTNIQRFGECDLEEKKKELYTDYVKVDITHKVGFHTRYNVSILDNVEYSCVEFNARAIVENVEVDKLNNTNNDTETAFFQPGKPRLSVQGWCSTPATRTCHYGPQFMQIIFFVEIVSDLPFEFQLFAYGKEAAIIDVELAWEMVDKQKPEIPKDPLVFTLLILYHGKDIPVREFKWFEIRDVYKIFNWPNEQQFFNHVSKKQEKKRW